MLDFILSGNHPSLKKISGHLPGMSELSDLFNLNKMFHLANHSQNLGSGFYFNSSIHLPETKSFHCALLTLGPVDSAFYLRDFDLFHILMGDTRFIR